MQGLHKFPEISSIMIACFEYSHIEEIYWYTLYIPLDTFGLQMVNPWNIDPSAGDLVALSTFCSGTFVTAFAVFVRAFEVLPSTQNIKLCSLSRV